MPGIEPRLHDVARQAITVRDSSGTTVTAIRLGGPPIGSLGVSGRVLDDAVLQSITNLAAIALERARGREATARAEAARQSGDLRATVLDALAHEFKTPLTSLKLAASDLQASGALAEHQRELVSIIDEDVTRLDGLVGDVVRMLRIDAGDFVLRRDRHRLADLISPVLASFGHRLEGHQVVAAVPEGVTLVVDAELVGLALRQLLDNALKYSPPSSTITITAESNGHVRLAVANTGSHIPARELDKVFDRFYRGSAARHVPGTGIGLSIVRTIAEAHGGSLSASSSADTGAAFVLTLPKEGEP
jgi:two-component system sensor histidine kinase KdpD